MPFVFETSVACGNAHAIASLRTLALTFAGDMSTSPASDEYRVDIHDELFDADLRLCLAERRTISLRVWPKPTPASGRALDAATIHNIANGKLRPFTRSYRDSQYKIFGIGFPRTGTTSLREALGHLGFFTLHYAPWLADDIAAGVYRSTTTDAYTALLDSPFPLIYKPLDRIYPHSKFILTTRAVDEWLPSIRDTEGGFDSEAIKRMYYGTTEFDEGVYRDTFLAHVRDVTTYFADRPRDLLVLNCSEHLRWTALCEFLDMPEPQDAAYPWAGRRPGPRARS